ncbi:hypothetical protein HY989_06990 [Candidatus Micrarchaeota archaeon]|nr:hypothetical protein [Candidatus Micrarchaeota archaeon]
MYQKILVVLIASLLLFGCTSNGNAGSKTSVAKTPFPETKIISKSSPNPSNSNPTGVPQVPSATAQLNEFQAAALQTQTETNAISSQVADADAVINDIDALVSLEGFA